MGGWDVFSADPLSGGELRSIGDVYSMTRAISAYGED